jgi:hypothetical protein
MRTRRQYGMNLSMTESDRSRTHTNRSRQLARKLAARTKDTDDAAKEDFLLALRAFREDAGRPPYRTLVRISRELGAHYSPPADGTCSLAEMSLTAVSEILAGKRKRLPTFEWVASFVLSCQRSAVEERVIKNDRGTTILPAWFAIRAEHAAAVGWDGQSPSADSDGTPGGGLPVTCQLPPDQQAFVASHGPHGLALLGRAQRGHPDARYRVALLMATDPQRVSAATSLLIDVAATGHVPSLDLLDACPEHLSPRTAADRALRLADVARERGADDEALAFLRAAVRGGIGEAALRYAQILLARNGEVEPAAWLASLIIQHAAGRHRHDRV